MYFSRGIQKGHSHFQAKYASHVLNKKSALYLNIPTHDITIYKKEKILPKNSLSTSYSCL